MLLQVAIPTPIPVTPLPDAAPPSSAELSSSLAANTHAGETNANESIQPLQGTSLVGMAQLPTTQLRYASEP